MLIWTRKCNIASLLKIFLNLFTIFTNYTIHSLWELLYKKFKLFWATKNYERGQILKRVYTFSGRSFYMVIPDIFSMRILPSSKIRTILRERQGILGVFTEINKDILFTLSLPTGQGHLNVMEYKYGIQRPISTTRLYNKLLFKNNNAIVFLLLFPWNTIIIIICFCITKWISYSYNFYLNRIESILYRLF